ncbi:MAG: Type IV fimbrial biogenesis protein PilY1 [Burkholderiaceae bacterium]|jgi:type IV pilus assembly protein PilY1|nr:MAG: Type IV fimbrial biogenesis protein PilY1 [Burkholderiaceae bacterium]
MNDCTENFCVTHRAGSRRPLSARDPARYTAAATAASPWRALAVLALAGLLTMLSATWALAQTTVNLAQVPLLALKSAPGLVMLTMSRDHRLFYAAYNDASDIDGDGVLDVGFKPSITYYGNFVSDRCYAYSTSTKRFSPKAVADPNTGCLSAPSSARWHGNWLNWATTSRMDALRRVLYGGYRVFDPASGTTRLQGAYIPQDSHVWGKEYRPVAGRDSYNVTYYTPLAAPNAGKQHLFAVRSPAYSSTPSDTGSGAYPFPMPAPDLRVIQNADQVKERIWNWASTDVGYAPIADDNANFSNAGGRNSVASTAYSLVVEACVALGGARESDCTGYPAAAPTVWKPTGVLHDYTANDALKFGLITGSYQNNYSGGVVRRNIGSFASEVDPANGVFQQVAEGSATVDGIARTIDRLSIYGWSGSSYYCGTSFSAPRAQRDCESWGAPVAEMMYEGLRYFSGKTVPSATYAAGVGNADSPDTRLRLPLLGTATSPWKNPYRAKSAGGNPICSRPVQMVIADPVTSFDSDQLPGIPLLFAPPASMGAALGSNDLVGLNVSSQSDAIWSAEGLGTRNIFIGQSGTLSDGNPTAKPASSFAQIRGHAPDATQSQGSYYAAAVARFGRKTGVTIGAPTASPAVPAVTGQPVDTLSIALGSVVPKIEIAFGGKKVSIVPVSKSVGPSGYVSSPAYGRYQATGAITGFYLDSFNNTSGPSGVDYNAAINGGRPTMSFVVNFSDSDEGTDNETDAIVAYNVSVDAAGKLVVGLVPVNTTAAGIEMHLGYSITGTAKDGLYLDMSSKPGGSAPGIKYYLDTLTAPTTQDPAPSDGSRINAAVLPATATTRTFDFAAVASTAGYVPHDPLWYAAKYGGAGITDSNGDPTNYFRISNPAQLPEQMGKAFRSAAALAAVASTSVVGVGQRSLGSAAIYQANYDSLTWSSRLYAFGVAANGDVSNTPLWEASSKIPAPASRNTLFLGRGGTATPVALMPGGFTSLTPAEQSDFGDAATLAYLLGDKSGEERNGGKFRNRGTTAAAAAGSVLGDIVNSDPLIISKKDYGYAAGDPTYTAYLNSINSEMLAVGANSGFFHVFDAQPDATGGSELLGFMPQAARANIKELANPGYQHRNFIDGSIGIGHAKIKTPSDATVKWRTVVAGAGGAGAQAVFAIDASSKTFSANSILWEINQSSSGIGTTLGNIMGRPAIGKLSNGTWVAIFGNGYNSADGTAKLYVVRLDTGAVIRILDTNNTLVNNGLGAIEMVRKTSGNADTIDAVYGADYRGNIWRFDPNVNTSGALIYSAGVSRPITAEIKVGPAPSHANTSGGRMIYFGTGSYLSATDPTNTSPQALYGIYDDLVWSNNLAPFVTSDSLLASMTIAAAAGADTRTTSKTVSPFWYEGASLAKKGWMVPLTGANVVAGERVIAQPVRYTVAGLVDAFLFTSIVPSTDECVAGLDAWITGIDALTGGYSKVFSDPIIANSVRIRGGSPRGVFVLQDGGKPALYISQTVFGSTDSSTSYATSAGGEQTVSINGVDGTTRVIKIDLNPPVPAAAQRRQVWRQLR